MWGVTPIQRRNTSRKIVIAARKAPFWELARAGILVILLFLTFVPVSAQEPAGTPGIEVDAPVPVTGENDDENQTSVPTEPNETEVPAEPTGEPDVTPEPTLEPTSEAAEPDAEDGDDPAGEGTPAPDAEEEATVAAPAPFEPILECRQRVDDERIVAGTWDWWLLECSLDWETEGVAEIRLKADTQANGWSLLLLEPEDADDAEEVNQLNRLEPRQMTEPMLTLLPAPDADVSVDPFVSAAILIGVRTGCLAPLNTTLDLEITAYADDPDGETYVEEVREELELRGQMPERPELNILQLTFAPIENVLESRRSTGSLQISFSDAPATCGWSISVGFSDFVAGEYRFSASNLTADEVEGIDEAFVTNHEGVITILIPESDTPRERDGVLQVALELGFDSFVPGGVYQTTATVDAAVEP